jgi:hypothetical protein
MRNILIGGKLGDFIHALILPKYLFETTGEKFNIYICNHDHEVFASGVENSFNELSPIVSNQSYVNNFEIWANQEIDIDLTRFRTDPNLFTASWNELYLRNYINPNIEIPFNYSWLEVKKDSAFKDLLLINRNFKPLPHLDTIQYYLNYIEYWKDKAYFVCSYIEQYTTSPFFNKIPMLYLPLLKDMTTAIASCDHFLGNLTATSAIAMACNTNRTIEMDPSDIRVNYIFEMKNYSTMSCFG